MGKRNLVISGLHKGQRGRLVLAAVLAGCLMLLPSCGRGPAETGQYRYVGAAEVASLMMERNAVVVDTMSYLECMDHRIPGSKCLAVEEFEVKAAAQLPDKKKPTVLYCESEECPRAAKACEKAKRLGYEDLFILKGGLAAWKKEGYEVETVERVRRAPVVSIKSDKIEGFRKQKKDLFILDIRSEEAFGAGHLDGAVNIPLYLLHKQVKAVPKRAPVLVVDESGKRSFLACCYLVNHGVQDVTRLFGGMESMAPKARRKG